MTQHIDTRLDRPRPSCSRWRVFATGLMLSACTGGLDAPSGSQAAAGATGQVTATPGATNTPAASGSGKTGTTAPAVNGPQAVPPPSAAGGAVLYTQVFNEVTSGCAGFCHKGGTFGLLDLVDEFESYSALVNIDPMGTEMPPGTKACAGSGTKRVVPGNAEASLLYLKLAGRPPCGTAMPPPDTGAPLIPADKLDLVKRWIDGGALPGLAAAPGAVDPRTPPATASTKPTTIEWPSFGPTHENTRYNRAESKLSVENVSQLKVKWMNQLSGGMNGIPALVGGVLYYADYGQLYAVNPDTGARIWSARVSQTQASPLVTSDMVYASGGRSLYAFDRMTGQSKWTVPLNDHPNTTIISAPILAGNLIVIGVAGNELATAKADYTFVGWVKGVNKDTGEIVWTLPVSGQNGDGNGVSVWSSAAIDEARKLAFIGTGNAYEEPVPETSDALLAINYETGDLVWAVQFSLNDWYVSADCPTRDCDADFDIGASPNLLQVNGVDAVAVGSKGGIFKVLKREDGSEIWSVDLHLETGRGAAGGIMTTAAIGENLIYTNSNQWVVHGFRRTGQHDPMDTSTTYALDLATGATVWKTKVPAPAIGMALLANGVVYQALINGAIYAFDASNGKIVWEGQNLGHDLAPGFNLTDGVLYGGSGGTWWVAGSRGGANIVAYSLE